MCKKNRLTIFDFDGTITKKDTLPAFAKYAVGCFFYYKAILCCLPWLFIYKLGLYSNGKAKQRLFRALYKGLSVNFINQKAIGFSDFCFQNEYLRTDIIQRVKECQENGDLIIIITASMENKVIPFALKLGIPHLLGTTIETKDGIITGNFSSLNCFGMEKVNRLVQLFPNRNMYHITLYSDSKQDEPLMNFCDGGYYI